MKYFKLFFSVYPLVITAQNMNPGDGYLTEWESPSPSHTDTQISDSPPGMVQTSQFLQQTMEEEGGRKRKNKSEDDEDEEEQDLTPSTLVENMSQDEASSLKGMAVQELEAVMSLTVTDSQTRILETAMTLLPSFETKDGITEQATDSILEGPNNPFRNGKGSCRSASSGKKSKKNGGCDAVLPLNLNYGCWCHADNTDIFKGKGQPVDEFDKACKMYKQCLRCVRLDSRNDGLVCDPGSQNYTTVNHRSKDGIHAECSRNNDGDCATNTCCCEVEYVQTILKLFMIDGVRLNKKHYHHHFDHDAKCQGVGAGGHEVDCCGPYPHRRMYNTHGKQCCHNQSVFDPYTHVCCEDGEPARSISECDNPNRNAKQQKRKKRAIERENFIARMNQK